MSTSLGAAVDARQTRKDATTRPYNLVAVSLKSHLVRKKGNALTHQAEILLQSLIVRKTLRTARQATTAAHKALDSAMSGQPWMKADQHMVGSLQRVCQTVGTELLRREGAKVQDPQRLGKGRVPATGVEAAAEGKKNGKWLPHVC